MRAVSAAAQPSSLAAQAAHTRRQRQPAAAAAPHPPPCIEPPAAPAAGSLPLLDRRLLLSAALAVATAAVLPVQPAVAIQGITAGRIPGVTGPDAEGYMKYQRPEGKSGEGGGREAEGGPQEAVACGGPLLVPPGHIPHGWSIVRLRRMQAARQPRCRHHADLASPTNPPTPGCQAATAWVGPRWSVTRSRSPKGGTRCPCQSQTWAAPKSTCGECAAVCCGASCCGISGAAATREAGGALVRQRPGKAAPRLTPPPFAVPPPPWRVQLLQPRAGQAACGCGAGGTLQGGPRLEMGDAAAAAGGV